MSNLEFYSETLKMLNKNKVRYLVVGGYAVNSYGYMRSTGDMDLWIDVTYNNLENLKKALSELGYTDKEIKRGIEELRAIQNISLKHNEFFKIEFISFLSSTLKFEEAYFRKSLKTVLEVKTPIIDIEDLYNLKIKSGRNKDLLDVKELKRIRNSK
jgi:hypothetical protein